MKRRLIYFLALLLIITAVAVNESGKGVMAMDNVSYIMPFLHTHTNNVVYCIASNMSSDNATVSISVMTNPTGYSLSWTPVALSGLTLNARQTTMLTFSGSTVTSSSGASGDISSSVASGGNAYGAIVNFVGANTTNTTTGIWYTRPPLNITAVAIAGAGQGGGTIGGFSSLPSYTYGKAARLQNGSYVNQYMGYSTVPLTCQTMGLACFQGTTSPKRNLVGYMCMDTVNSMYPPTGY
ncbi:MAG: hypothetical protein H7844_01615 [Nitrospirae bacterium YQR-1]